MKNLLNIILFCSAFSTIASAQKVSATLKEIPGQINTAIIAMKSDASFNSQFASVTFVIQIPADVNPQPTLAVSESFVEALPAGAWTQESITEGGFHNYILGIATANPPNTNVVANTEIDIIRISFSGLPDLNLSKKIRVAHLANGGPGTKYGYSVSVGGNDFTNYVKMFYSSPSSISFPESPLADEGLGYETYQYAESSNAILPVEFRSFYALKSGDDAKLTWQVSADLNNKHFEVLRSIDGTTFKEIQTIKALDNGRAENSYETKDFSISKLGSREVFYQIKQIDKDGAITNSPVRKLSVDGLGKSVSAFPNPASNTTKVKVDAIEAGQGNLIMRDAMGRQVRLLNAQFHRGINLFDMNLLGLASGEYTIQVNGGGLNESIKLTKVQ